jgi:cell division septation protein DedD
MERSSGGRNSVQGDEDAAQASQKGQQRKRYFWDEGGGTSMIDKSSSENEWKGPMIDENNVAVDSAEVDDEESEQACSEDVPESNRYPRGKVSKGCKSLHQGSTPLIFACGMVLLVALGGMLYSFSALSKTQDRLDKLEKLSSAREALVPHGTLVEEVQNQIKTDLQSIKQDIEANKQSIVANGDVQGGSKKLLEEMKVLQKRVAALEIRLPVAPAPRAQQLTQGSDGKTIRSRLPGNSRPSKPPSVLAAKNSGVKSSQLLVSSGRWEVNLASFTEQHSALALQKKVKAAGYSAKVSKVEVAGKSSYRVSIPGIANKDKARQLNLEVQRKTGLTKSWVSKN